MKNTLMQNPLSNIQSYQQSPVGIQGLIAQYLQQQQAPQQQSQQQAPDLSDSSQLSDFIQRLQDKGASSEQINGLVNQIQQNGGQLPNNDTVQGSEGTDTIATDNNTPQSQQQQSQQSPLSQQLNAVASGSGNVDYDALGNAYPTPRPMPQMSQQDLLLQALAKPNSGGAAGGLYDAMQAAKAQDLVQRQTLAQQLNQRDIGAFGAQTGLAEKAGQLAAEKARNDRELDNEQERTGIMQQNADAARYKPLGMDANGNAVVYDQKTGQTQTIPNVHPTQRGNTLGGNVSAAQEEQVKRSMREALNLDKNNQPTDEELPINGTDLVALKSAANTLLASGKAKSADEAVKMALGNVNLVPDKNNKTSIFGRATQRVIDDPSALSGIVNMNQPQTAPAVGGQASSSPDTSTQSMYARPKTKAELDALESGTKYINPANNAVYIKP